MNQDLPAVSKFMSAVALALGMVATLSACSPRRDTVPDSKTERFRLSASPGTVDGYLATIDEARFTTSGGGSFPVPYGHFLRSGWGGTAIGWAVGDPMQPAPDTLEIRWFSYTEDKFYQGVFPLPHERIHALLKQGYWDDDLHAHVTYNDMSLSVAPTGVVYVWLRSPSTWRFIGRYQAQEIEYDYALHRPKVDRAADVRESRAQASPQAQQEIATGTLSAKRWDDYLKTYPWKLAFSQPLTLTDFGVGYVNAERVGAG